MLLRPIQTDDLDALYEISLATGDAGGDASGLYRDGRLLGHIYAAPYARLAPELAFVAEDAGGVAGYVVGVTDTRAFEALLEREWWPALRGVYPDPSDKPPAGLTSDDRRMLAIHHPTPSPEAVVRAFPAHLHLNLAARAQGRGLGTALLARWLAAAEGRGVRAVHVGVNSGNAGGLGFWRRRGFVRLDLIGRTVWMGRTRG